MSFAPNWAVLPLGLPPFRDRRQSSGNLNLEVVVGDVIVVGLHLAEGLLVVLHEIVDVEVLSLLDLVNVHLRDESIESKHPRDESSRDAVAR